jgi:ubiquinone/menaquinone biosynthesis C-methylase UbiE
MLLLLLLTIHSSDSRNVPSKYYFDPRIHNFGNIGFGGRIHSIVAPYATKLIDEKCYNSVNIRQVILSNYNQEFYNANERMPKLIDLCCGTGASTWNNQLGIDTSSQMIAQAKKIQRQCSQFLEGNAEDYGKEDEFDAATIMFAFHEMPNYAHHKIINNAKRITTSDILIVDIDPKYRPSKLMLSGEPYLLNYKKTIHTLLEEHQFSYLEYIPNHVGMWVFKHTENKL